MGWSEGSDYVVSTIHRQENTDDVSRLSRVISHLAGSSREVRLLVHPRLAARARESGVSLAQGNIRLFEPLSYPQLVHAVMNAAGVVTDSGGLQKEAFLLGTPCITLRSETEWVETVELDWNVVDGDCSVSIDSEFARERRKSSHTPYGEGNAAANCVSALEKAVGQ
jgi:UDP-N-acetylglucosamine 2-epimerase (non-hydrolysing)